MRALLNLLAHRKAAAQLVTPLPRRVTMPLRRTAVFLAAAACVAASPSALGVRLPTTPRIPHDAAQAAKCGPDTGACTAQRRQPRGGGGALWAACGTGALRVCAVLVSWGACGARRAQAAAAAATQVRRVYISD